MRAWKILIRIWLTLVSLASFAVGWVVLAHSPKPNQFNPASVPAAPKLDPVPSLDQITRPSNDDGPRSFVQVQPVQRAPMVLRSGGS